MNKSGSILIVCLWALGVLSILSMALAGFVFQEIKFANSFSRLSVSLPLAKAASLHAFYERRNDATPEYDTLEELRKERTQTLCSDIDYRYYFVDKKNIDGQEQTIDESTLININLASSETLKRLPGLDEDLVKVIIDSPRRPFKLKEELLLIEGLDKDKFNQFKDLITVYGEGKININTVSSEVLSILGLDADLVQIIMRYREEYPGADGEWGTEDDGAFINPSNILSDLRGFNPLTLKQEQDLLAIINILGVKSEYLRLNVIPQIKARSGIHYSILIYPAENKIISWWEYYP